MTTLTSTVATITPLLITGYESARPSTTIVHRLLSGDEAVSLSKPGARTGVLGLLFDDEAAAAAAELAHATPTVWTLTEPGRPTLAMSYVVDDGDIVRELEDDTRRLWLVRVPFKEVLP